MSICFRFNVKRLPKGTPEELDKIASVAGLTCTVDFYKEELFFVSVVPYDDESKLHKQAIRKIVSILLERTEGPVIYQRGELADEEHPDNYKEITVDEMLKEYYPDWDRVLAQFYVVVPESMNG